MKSHIEGKIRGKVQGVCFRDATCDFARSIGIDGFVRNEPDGTVYIEAEGEESQLEALREWLREGPSAAQVEEVDLGRAELKDYEGFNVQT
ncbi:MAG: acylphosphatase [Opitutales bacterium]